MLERIKNPKNLVIVAILVGIFALACLVLFARLGWTAYRNRSTPSPTVEPVTFGYCGEKLNALCVVSFGRDVYGNTIINLYVPLRKYPLFYLNIVRLSGEGRYECEWNKSVRTSVYCVGAPINLGEGFEIQMFSDKDDSLLAKGTFTLTAFLVTTPIADGAVPATISLKPTFTSDVDETSTPTSTPATPTNTPSSSYPNYP